MKKVGRPKQLVDSVSFNMRMDKELHKHLYVTAAKITIETGVVHSVADLIRSAIETCYPMDTKDKKVSSKEDKESE